MSAAIIPLHRWGAMPDEWLHLSLILGLTSDLLPVVSNPQATISPESKMKALGKTPSRYNHQGNVAGIASWTQHQSTAHEIAQWKGVPDYGICIQTRRVRAIDVDLADDAGARAVLDACRELVGVLPCRVRANAAKFLLGFTLEGDYTKRSFKADGGIVEFLATGQQFVAVGTHPSGARYEWEGGLPDEFPVLTPEQFEALWAELVKRFAIEAPTERKAASGDGASSDPVVQLLREKGLVLAQDRDHTLHITCPFADEHTTDSGISSTSYFPRWTNGIERGHFKCLHAHCEQRGDGEFLAAIGYREGVDDFEVVDTGIQQSTTARFQIVTLREYLNRKPPAWHVKGVLPDADLAVVYGESTVGKTFFVFDLVAAVALGDEQWREKRVKEGRVVYIAAEDAAGLAQRAEAYRCNRGLCEDAFDGKLDLIAEAPDFMRADDIAAVVARVKAWGETRLIVVDTFARVMAGANENAGEDVGKAIAHCGTLRRATGATVILVHHSGKDAARGARGWSGLRAAADAELEITRVEEERVATITKMKNGRDGDEFGFELDTVSVGNDSDGDAITSCIVRATKAKPKALRKKAVKGSNELIVLRVLDDLAGLGAGPDFHTLLEASVAQLVPPEDGQRDRRREVMSRTINGLMGEHIKQKRGLLERVGVSDAQ